MNLLCEMLRLVILVFGRVLDKILIPRSLILLHDKLRLFILDLGNILHNNDKLSSSISFSDKFIYSNLLPFNILK